MKRIGILTAGGDTPALNATIHGAVVRANQLEIEVYGLIKGFNCLFNPRVPHVHLNPLFQADSRARSDQGRHASSAPRATTSIPTTRRRSTPIAERLQPGSGSRG